MNIIFEINGGIGKSVMGTAVVSAIKKKYPDGNIIVVTAYPEVFMRNPEVFKAILPATPFFFEEYIRGRDTKIFRLEPYMAESHIKGECHLLKTWCNLFGLEYQGEMPKIYLSELEIDRAKIYKGSAPIALIHPFGGFSESISYSWNRDMPPAQAQELARALGKDIRVAQIARKGQKLVAAGLTAPFREIAACIAVSNKRIFIDSFAQHVAAALSLPSTVLWITNKPEVFGYDTNRNILARPFDNQIKAVHAYLEEFDFTGNQAYQYPYNNDNIFDIDGILDIA